MGALCGKEAHFAGEGYTLSSSDGVATTAPSRSTKLSAPPVTGTGRMLGGTAPSVDLAEREARAKAAEARAKAASTRGTQGTGGKINAALASQPADGGRVKDALVEGSNRAAPPLVYD